jgi:hypothetical protein
MNTAYADQIHAASRDARRLIHAAAEHGGGTVTADQPPPWLVVHLARLGHAMTTGQGRICPHLGASPRVVLAAAWAPGLLVCPRCAYLLTPTVAEDTTCDRCRRHIRHIHPGAAAVGPILLVYGLCRSCHIEQIP